MSSAARWIVCSRHATLSSRGAVPLSARTDFHQAPDRLPRTSRPPQLPGRAAQTQAAQGRGPLLGRARTVRFRCAEVRKATRRRCRGR
eukprot:scaffold4161_cov101-Isochrysis_galbana.AAC.4